MTVLEAFFASYDARVKAPARPKRPSVVGVLLGNLVGYLVIAFRALLPLAYTLGALALAVFAAWHTFGVGAGALAAAVSLLVLEFRTRE